MPRETNGKHKEEKCICCIKTVKWIPVLFIVAIIVWSYYAYVFQLCLITIQSSSERIVLLVVYHISLVMFFWTYGKTVCSCVARVPEEFRLSESEQELLIHAATEEIQLNILEIFAKNLPVLNRTLSGGIRYCEKCHHVKPDRAHHCSVCGECILKMDHHCPWINNCVSFSNYKFFILFLGYSLIYCIFISATSVQYFIAFWKGELEGMGKFHILFLFFVALMFAVSLASLFGYHCYLVLHNRTTLEAFRPAVFCDGPDKNGFNLGAYNNFRQVFGNRAIIWFFPIKSSVGDGVSYPVPRQHSKNSYHSMDTTPVR
ncbi:hypothetical protein ILUMI_27086 [Ignelater luminosus]|uniref:Palmitoyltransferase n=1 Tax=Ignelater luminosus TaxID=2038154 RepID=A0A8K0C5G6_IGNLU|nr:hypothetical protein ILUMI_27086 [Ignelater luminosus]